MSELEAVFLGLVQGFTEFLPVSSSGHLTIFKEILGIETSNLSFEVAVHAATVMSTIVAFHKQIWKLILGFFNFKMNQEKTYIFMILLSMIPVFIVGVLLKDQVEAIFGSGLLVVGCMLLVTAALLSTSEILTKKYSGEGKELTYKSAFIIGCAQAIAVLPGLSRSGSTISTGLILGLKKEQVAQFSFLMVLIPILGETFLGIVGGDFSSSEAGIDFIPLMLGALSAFISGLIACKIMINLVKKAKLWGFAIYCAIAAIACIISVIVA